MATQTRNVGIVCLRRKLSNPWVDESVAPHSVLADAPVLEAPASLGRTEAGELVYFGAGELTFYSGETGHYRDNLLSGAPRLWVVLKPVEQGLEFSFVTANPYEGEAASDGSGTIVEAVDMPGSIAADLAAFVERHHVEEVFVKRQRDKGKGERRGPGGGGAG